ncbi:MAG: hypothetical protein H6734_09330 [Alphaproteobacteria bacterium]|nr:hypothetical protein [Alphaproteobacteria bacterium]
MWLDRLKGWFQGAPPEGSAARALRELKEERGEDPEWVAMRNRLGVLVLSEGDQQRLWQRAHHGEASSARLLSGIARPTEDEKRILAALLDELARGR